MLQLMRVGAIVLSGLLLIDLASLNAQTRLAIVGGYARLISPEELTSPPSRYAPSVYQPMGLNHPGWVDGYNAELHWQHSLGKNVRLSVGGGYSAWISKTPLNDGEREVGEVDSELLTYSITVGPEVMLLSESWLRPVVNMGLMVNLMRVTSAVASDELEERRLAENYFRVGMNGGLGIELGLGARMSLVLNVKYVVPNLLLRTDDDPSTPKSEAVIHAPEDTTELRIRYFMLTSGIAFKL